MNDVTPFAGSALAPSSLQSRLQRFKKTRPRSEDGSIYLKMAKDGIWSYGAEEVVPEDDSLWAVNPASLQQGYVCWPDDDKDRGGGPLAEEMFEAGEDIPFISEMPRQELGTWTDQLAVQMQCVKSSEEEDVGVAVVYKVNSKSGVRELNRLIDAIITRIDEGESTVPVVALGNDSYRHKKYGKIYTPELNIQYWLDINTAPDEQEPDEEKPKSRRRRAADPKPAEDEKPQTRTRRRGGAKAAAPEPEASDDDPPFEPDEPKAEAEPAEDEAPVRRRRRRGR